jgi:hypothetical protein
MGVKSVGFITEEGLWDINFTLLTRTPTSPLFGQQAAEVHGVISPMWSVQGKLKSLRGVFGVSTKSEEILITSIYLTGAIDINL